MGLTTLQPTETAALEQARQLLERLVAERDATIAAERDLQHGEIRRVMEAMRSDILRVTKLDPARLGWRERRFSIRELRRDVDRYVAAHLREANAESTFGQLLRYGVQHYLFDAYQQVPTVWPALFETRPSSNLLEWYAPMYGTEIPEDVETGGKFDDSKIRGIDVTVQNKKVGRILSVERELVDDDQTGQIVKKASQLGQRMRYKEEIDALLAIVNARDFSNGPTGETGYTTVIGNRPTTLGALTLLTLEAADIAMRKMKDPMGNFFLVVPDTLLVGADNAINVFKLLNSVYYPAIPGAAGESMGGVASGGVASGGTGWTMTENYLKGRYTPVVATLLSDTRIGGDAYWFLMQAKQGAVFQDRDPLEVVQENPLSGTAFEYDAYRYRVRRRYAAKVIEPRFIYEGQGAQ